MDGAIYTLILVVAFLAVTGIKIASEYERFAVFRLGRFFGFKGPGILYKFGHIEKWVRIKPGDRGELLDTALAKVNNVEVPVRVDGKVAIGQPIRVTRFQGEELLVTADSVEGNSVVCQKCGYVNQL